MNTRLVRTVGALVLALGVSSCGAKSEQVTIAECVEPITIFAASSLAEPLTTIAEDFDKKNYGCDLTKLVFGASSSLAEQIKAGAPAHVFISASPASMKTAESEIAVSSVFLRNRVVLAFDSKSTLVGIMQGTSVNELLNEPSRKWIMCALEVPCGAAGKRALDAEGVTTQPISLEPDVKSVVAKLTSGEIPFAIVYHTDIVAHRLLQEIEFRDQAAATTEYMLGLTKNDNTTAQAFMSFLYLNEAQQTLRDAGFDTDMSK